MYRLPASPMPLVRLLLPALIPSWRFFKTVAPSPRVEYRLDNGNWQECRHRPPRVGFGRMLRRMLWNPRWNAQLYLVSLSERLAETPTEHSITELNNRIARLVAAPDGARLRFRLVFVCREGAEIIKFIEYESAAVTVGAH